MPSVMRLLIAIECFDDRVTYKIAVCPMPVIHIDIDAVEIGKNVDVQPHCGSGQRSFAGNK